MRNDDGFHFIEDCDGDTILIGDPDDESGERYIACESSSGDRQAVVLTREQQDELLDLLAPGGFDREQIIRAAIVQDLIGQSLSAGVFQGKALSSDSASAILALASYIEGGAYGVCELKDAVAEQ